MNKQLRIKTKSQNQGAKTDLNVQKGYNRKINQKCQPNAQFLVFRFFAKRSYFALSPRPSEAGM